MSLLPKPSLTSLTTSSAARVSEAQPLLARLRPARPANLGVSADCCPSAPPDSRRMCRPNRIGLATGIGNPFLSVVESGFPTITEPVLHREYFSHDFVLATAARGSGDRGT